MMIMTNYMELLAANSPWNLILFMVIPVVAAEALVATEFYTLFLGEGRNETCRRIEKQLGIFAGVYFALATLYLLFFVVPGLEWKGAFDIIAVGSYLLGVIPLGAIALMELGILFGQATEKERTRKHFELLIGFLIVSHIAMVFGMVDPMLSGWTPEPTVMQTEMPAMDHSGMNHGGMNHGSMHHNH